jgi:glycosyltransferase involved in cell wall biosynthesis/capsular polysaccharide biosynthesis protein
VVVRGTPSAYRIDVAADECGATLVVISYRSSFVMRDPIVELSHGDHPAGGIATSPALNAPAKNLDPGLISLLQLFLDQASPIRSIVALGCPTLRDDNRDEPVLFRVVADRGGISAVHSLPPSGRGSDGLQKYTHESLGRQAHELCGEFAGDDLLLLPEQLLDAMMTRLDHDFGFRAVAVLSANGNGWRLQRSLFDRGLVGIGSVQIGGIEARCFLSSDAIRSPNQLVGVSRGQITMAALGRNGRFANQLFQYAYVKLYALRHGLTAAFPDWEGRALFGLKDPGCAGLALPQLVFNGFTDDDRHLWELDDPPADVDLWGYFQEIPECWRRHRPLLRRMFELSVEDQNSIDVWHNDLTRGGKRTLVAVHVRRGDYRGNGLPWLRLVPEEFYLDWLRTTWQTLCDPLLFVATDEPKEILQRFKEFAPISATGSLQHLPAHVRDFEILRRADYLAICNSSFSRMAAILAPSIQRCFLPSFQMRCFTPYEPWIDPGFWARFAEDTRSRPLRSERQRQPALTAKGESASISQSLEPTIYFDVSDLLLYCLDHPTLSGIQRVQCEIIRHLLDLPQSGPIGFVILNDGDGLGSIETSALLDVIDVFHSAATPSGDVRVKIRALLHRALPCNLRPGDVFLTMGAFWAVRGTGRLLQHLKNSGVIIGVLIHDIIPITDPEYFEAGDTKVFVKAMVEVLTFADFVLTSSAYNKASLATHLAARNLKPLSVHVVPLAHELSKSVTTQSRISDVVAGLINAEYVLCVGTIEVRKNPTYLFNIWKLMMQSGRVNIPTLVFAGGKGWLVRDFIEQVEACNYLGGRIVVLHNVTEVELDQLYQRCLLTMFPSFAEGWGLPVGESLSYGKISICSSAGGIPEVGGALADYVDPYNARGGLEQLLRYLDDPELRRRREDEIVQHFQPRSWRQVADAFLRSIRSLAGQVRQIEGIAAITLPPNQFLPISTNASAIPLDGIDGSLSAELVCVSGWRAPETWGVWADEPTATLRFRAAVPAGSRIHLVMRLAAPGRNYRRIRISSGSGAETSVSLGSESDSLAVLSCEVEPDNLVTAYLSLMGTSEGQLASRPYWHLKGILYFQPERLAAEARVLLAPAGQMEETRRAASFAAFLNSTDSYWPTRVTTYRDPPIFAHHADREIFNSRYRNSQTPRVGEVADRMTLIRRSDQYISMSRFTEGTVFDRSGVCRAFGYAQTAPPETPWLSRDADGIWVDEKSLAAAPRYEKSYLVFYNGNLHNYYHWMAEGILSLDILSRAMAPAQNLSIALPKSVDINAVFDHRDTLRALGFDNFDTVEVGANLIKVREAIWVESDDLIEQMPAHYLKDFQQRIASKYAGAAGPRNRRLLIGRKGPTRKIHNFERAQEFLSGHGFETAFLEGLSIVEQILLFQSAEFVIGTHGSGLTNLLFCEPGTKVIELMPSIEMRPFFWLISEKLNLTYAVQFCAAVDGDSFQASLNVDIGKLQALYRMVDAIVTVSGDFGTGDSTGRLPSSR